VFLYVHNSYHAAFKWSTSLRRLSSRPTYITPLLKKANLHPADPGNSHRPISNLTVISKLLERLVAKQIEKFLTDNKSASRSSVSLPTNHSTETTVLKVVADILLALDSGDLAALVLIDLSAAFNTVGHVLLRLLRTSYGIDGIVNDWFSSYLSGPHTVRPYVENHVDFVVGGLWSTATIGPWTIPHLRRSCTSATSARLRWWQPDLWFLTRFRDLQLTRENMCMHRWRVSPSKTEILWCIFSSPSTSDPNRTVSHRLYHNFTSLVGPWSRCILTAISHEVSRRRNCAFLFCGIASNR